MSDHSDHATDRCVFTVFSLCSHCVLTTFAPYYEYVLTVFSLCSHGVLTVFSPCSQLCSQLCSHLCSRCVIAVLSPCLLRGFELNSHRARTMLCLPLPRSISLYKLTHHISRMLPPPDQTGGVRQASMGPACLFVFGSPASPEDLAIPEPGSGVAAPLHTLSADPQRCQVRLDVGGLASGTPAKPCSWRARLSGGTPEKTPLKDTSLQERRCAGLPAEPRKLNLC